MVMSVSVEKTTLGSIVSTGEVKACSGYVFQYLAGLGKKHLSILTNKKCLFIAPEAVFLFACSPICMGSSILGIPGHLWVDH